MSRRAPLAAAGAPCALRALHLSGSVAASQAFEGSGCVYDNFTSCACRHLTDFSTDALPKIDVASAADLLSLSPLDIVTKLRLLLSVVVALFGGMHVFAGTALYRDTRDKRRVVDALKARSHCSAPPPLPPPGRAWRP